MTNRKDDDPLKEQDNEKSRRDFLKGGGVVAIGAPINAQQLIKQFEACIAQN